MQAVSRKHEQWEDWAGLRLAELCFTLFMLAGGIRLLEASARIRAIDVSVFQPSLENNEILGASVEQVCEFCWWLFFSSLWRGWSVKPLSVFLKSFLRWGLMSCVWLMDAAPCVAYGSDEQQGKAWSCLNMQQLSIWSSTCPSCVYMGSSRFFGFLQMLWL